MTEQKTHSSRYQQLAFYSNENHKWKRALGRRLCLTLPVIACTLFAAYKKNPILTIESGCVSLYGLYCVQRANFYRRRSAYRVRQQRKSLGY